MDDKLILSEKIVLRTYEDNKKVTSFYGDSSIHCEAVAAFLKMYKIDFWSFNSLGNISTVELFEYIRRVRERSIYESFL